MTAYSPSTGIVCTPNAAPNYSLASGFVNRLRNASLTQWYAGTSGTPDLDRRVWTAEARLPPRFRCERIVLHRQQRHRRIRPRNQVQLIGATSNTGMTCRFVLGSEEAAFLAGKTVTFQLSFINQTGASLTAQISSKYPSAADNWTTSTSDLAATSLQSCAAATLCTLAYTFTVNSAAMTGYEIVIGFGAIAANTKYIVLLPRFRLARESRCREPGSTPHAGRAGNPLGDGRSRAGDKRFYQCSYDNQVAPATATTTGLVAANSGNNSNATVGLGYTFPVSMSRADPTVSLWDGAGTSNKSSYYQGGWNNGFGSTSILSAAQGVLHLHQRHRQRGSALRPLLRRRPVSPGLSGAVPGLRYRLGMLGWG